MLRGCKMYCIVISIVFTKIQNLKKNSSTFLIVYKVKHVT